MVLIIIYCPDCNKHSSIDTSNLINPPYTTCACGSLNAHKVTTIREGDVSVYGTPVYGTPRPNKILNGKTRKKRLKKNE